MTSPVLATRIAREWFDPTGSFFLDGDRPVPHPVTLHINHPEQLLEIGLPDDNIVYWPLRDMRQLPDIAGNKGAVLRWTGDPLARLLLSNPGLLPHLPHLKRRAPPKGRGRLAAWALAAVAGIALQIGVLVPFLADQLASYIPPEGERALGEATFGQIRKALDDSGLKPLQTCEDPAGLAALGQMKARLIAGMDLSQDVEVFVLDHQMINAFALPGGYVVFFRGLIDAAQGPEEVAAVLAHEIGHVVNRDPTRHALRSAGSIGILGLMFGDFAGGAAVLFLTNRLIAAQYSQGAETGADRFAYGALHDAGVSPAALGDMFERLKTKHGDSEGVIAHFLTHPTLTTRIKDARAAARPEISYEPILTAPEWQALQSVCIKP